MMKIQQKRILPIICSVLVLAGCQKDTELLPIDEDQIFLDQLNKLIENTEALIMPDSNAYTEIPEDPQNPITKDKVILGQFLFHETSFGLNPREQKGTGTYSCASCHHAKAGFQSGLKQGIGEGGSGFGFKGETRIPDEAYTLDSLDVQPIRTPSILNAAYQEAMLWNGQFGAVGVNAQTQENWTEGTPKAINNLGFEGVETQAIAGIGVHRLRFDADLIKNSDYKALFDAAFPGSNESERYTDLNAGLAIAAYERTVLANEAPFQKLLKGQPHGMSKNEKEGALIFFGKGQCFKCHSGPGLNGMEFHALGMDDLNGDGFVGAVDVATSKGRGGFTRLSSDDYKFKTPTLYNLKDVEFLGHGGSFTTVREVIEYKNEGVAQNNRVPLEQLSSDFTPLNLTDQEIENLTAFIENSLHDNNLMRYQPTMTPLGNGCFPNADKQSKRDLDCN